MVEYVKNCKSKLKETFIVHGDEEQSECFKNNLEKLNIRVRIPAKDEVVLLSGEKQR